MHKIVYIFLLTFIALSSSYAQRFSLLAELGGMKTQVDGDKIQGFYYNGYTAGIGSNYAFNNENFISVKTAYYDQGSRRKNNFLPKPKESIQLLLDFSTVGLEISYKYKPQNYKYYIGIGVVHHQIIEFEHGILTQKKKDVDRDLKTEQVKGAFNSVKTYYGYRLFDRASLYVAAQVSTTNLMRSNFNEIKSLVPYSLELVFSYEIITNKEETTRKRPGTKSRSNKMK